MWVVYLNAYDENCGHRVEQCRIGDGKLGNPTRFHECCLDTILYISGCERAEMHQQDEKEDMFDVVAMGWAIMLRGYYLVE